jgi:hypothetical protein
MEISLFGAKLYGDFSLMLAKDSFVWNAGHGISRSIGNFTAGGFFYASPADGSVNHRLNMSYSSIFNFSFNAETDVERNRLSRKWNLGTGFRAPNVFIPSIAVNAQAAWTSREDFLGEDSNYASIWARTWKPLIPDTGRGADRRTQTSITLTEGTKPVGAVITLDGSTNYTGINSTARSESQVTLDVPVVFGSSSLTFNFGRAFKQHLLSEGEDALDDGRIFFEGLNDSLYFWAVPPGYSLFSGDSSDAMDRSLENSSSSGFAEYNAFHDRFAVSMRLAPVYNLFAFVLPSNASVRMERIIEQKLDTRADRLNISGSLGVSAINMFGALGYISLFKFYRSDEFTHTLETAVAIPEGEDPEWRVQSTLGMGFIGFSGGEFYLRNTLTFRSGGNWLESLRGELILPTERSLLSLFYNWVAGAALGQSSWLSLSALLNSEYEQFLREGIELVVDNQGDYLRWSLSLIHESTIRILGRLNLSVFAKLVMGEEQRTQTFSFAATIGTSLRLSF